MTLADLVTIWHELKVDAKQRYLQSIIEEFQRFLKDQDDEASLDELFEVFGYATDIENQDGFGTEGMRL